MLRWFGHVERMSESCLTKGIYKADVSGNAGSRRLRRTNYIDLIGEVLQKCQVRNTRNRRAYMIRYMRVVCSFCLPPWEKGVNLCMYE